MGKRHHDLKLRDLPARNSFSAPHIQSLATARSFYHTLELEVAAVHARVAEIGGDESTLAYIAAGGALERQGLSEAVQVFCAMTVEGATNLLGVLALGEEQFLATIERDPIVDKLKALYSLIRQEPLTTDDLLLTTARAICDARNSFVHPKPQEGEWRANSTKRRPDLDGARAAIYETGTFLTRIQQIDARFAIFLTVF